MMNIIHDLFLPHEKNNHRARILHNINILVLLVAMVFATVLTHYLKTAHPEILGISYSISEGDLVSLVNQKRAENGLSPLTLNAQLSDAARRKAADMLEKNYWAHFAPDGSTSPWGFIKAAGYNYVFAGENLAKGFTDSSSTVEAWMNSPTHRDNILSNKFNDVGFAIVPGTLSGEETVLVVEMFGTTASPFVAAAEQPQLQTAPEENPLTEVSEVGGETNELQKIEIVEEVVPTVQPVGQSSEDEKSGIAVISEPTVDVADASRAMSVAGFSFLAFAFAMDLVIVERKKIPRLVGHNLDHIMLIMIFILFMLLAKSGAIL